MQQAAAEHQPDPIDRRARTYPAGLVEIAITCVAMVMVSGAFTQTGFISFPITVIMLGAVAWGLFAMGGQFETYVRVAFSDWTIVGLVGLSALSLLWSFEPARTLDSVLWLILMTMFAVYIAASYSLREQFRLYLFSLAIIAYGSLIFGILFPAYGIHQTGPNAGAWRGAIRHKNDFSMLVSLLAIWSFQLGKPLKLLRWPTFAVAALLVRLSLGATAMMAMLLQILLFPLYRILRAHHMVLVGLMLLLAPLAAAASWMAINHYEEILLFFGRDASLTGRTELWDASLILIEERPLRGYGLRASFTDATGVYDLIEWQNAPYAHNNWLDTALDIGVIGAVLFTFSLLRSLWRAFQLARHSTESISLYPFVFFTFLLMILQSTTSLITTMDVLWLAFVALTLSLARATKQPQPERKRRPAAVPQRAVRAAQTSPAGQ